MKGYTREVVTLQFGEFANHVASQFWNLENANLAFEEDVKGDDEEECDSRLASSASSNPHRSHVGGAGTAVGAGYHPASTIPSGRRTVDSDRRDTESARMKQKQMVHSLVVSGRGGMIDSRVCMRKVRGSDGSLSRVPRTVVFCVKGEIQGSLADIHAGRGWISGRDSSTMSTATERFSDETWIGRVSRHSSGERSMMAHPPPPLSESADSRKSDWKSEYWDRRLSVSLDPKSIQCLDGVHRGVSSFGKWSEGTDQMSGCEERWMDCLRREMEKCEWPQSLQCISGGLHDSWSSVVPSVLQRVKDLYCRKPIILFDCSPGLKCDYTVNGIEICGSASQTSCIRRKKLNRATSICALYEHCSQIVPLQGDLIKHRRRRMSEYYYENIANISQCMAMAIHSCHSPCRLLSGGNRISVSEWMYNSNPLSSSNQRISFLSANSTDNLTSSLISDHLLPQTLEELFKNDDNGDENEKESFRPLFSPWLSCLSWKIPESKLDNTIISTKSSGIWDGTEFYGESTALIGTGLFADSSWLSSLSAKDARFRDPRISGMSVSLDTMRSVHRRLFAERNIRAEYRTRLSGAKQLWHSSYQPWFLPVNDYSKDDEDSRRDDDDDHHQLNPLDLSSTWTSLWTARCIGDTFLSEMAKTIGPLCKDESAQVRMFGDVNEELDLEDSLERVKSYAEAYKPFTVI